MAEPQTKLDDKLGDGHDVVPLAYEITSYGADYPVDGLVKRLENGDIFIPSFQRGFVWNFRQASRFIESFLLGLPVPGIFLSKDFETQKMIVIDGQQRLRTLQFFYEGVFQPTGRAFALRGVQQQFEGSTYKTLLDEERRRLDNSILHTTIIRQELPPADDSSIYYIFERLNTTGTPLSPQEIRSCIFRGEFNNLLKTLNKYEPWRSVYGRPNRRMRDEELIMRFFALHFQGRDYRRPMREFLNRYMGQNQHLELHSANQLTEVFSRTIQVISKHLGREAFRFGRRALNAAVFDAVMSGVAQRLERSSIVDGDSFRIHYHELLADERFLDVTLARTADESRVHARLDMATEAFREVT
jgi:hypothetical protein